MRKFIAAVFAVAFTASAALAQGEQAPTLRIVSEDGNRLPSELMYGNTKVKPLRLRPGTNVPITIDDSDFFVRSTTRLPLALPDQSGFAFWQNDINQCGASNPAAPRRAASTSRPPSSSHRVPADRFPRYKAYRPASATSRQARPRAPRELHARHALDLERRRLRRERLGEDVDNNKNATSVLRPAGDFQSAFPGSMTAAQFVTSSSRTRRSRRPRGERNAAARPSARQRGGSRRGAAAVTESQTLHNAEFNKAFVLRSTSAT